MSANKIYLDYASSTPLDELVKKSMQEYQSDIFFNASAIYDGGLKAKEALSLARQSIARFIGQDQLKLYLRVVVVSLITWQFKV